MSNKLIDFLSPLIIGVGVYTLLNKFFPEKNVSGIDTDFEDLARLIDLQKEKDLITEPSSLANKDLPGGDIVENPLVKKRITSNLTKKILTDRFLKLALVSIFTIAAIQHFKTEIKGLLVHKVFDEICVKNVKGQLKIVCDIIREHDLHLHSKAIKELLVTSNLSDDAKVKLLEIKLDAIINGEYGGKTRFLIVTIIALIITVTVSGVGGLAIFLEALYRLFQEGKISKLFYEQIVNLVTKTPLEDLQDLL